MPQRKRPGGRRSEPEPEPEPEPKQLAYMGRADKDLAAMPEDARDEILRSLVIAQRGGTAANAQLRPTMGKQIYQISADEAGDTYRCAYSVQIKGWLVILHAFKKKSTSGIATPKHEIDTIKTRIKAATRQIKGK